MKRFGLLPRIIVAIILGLVLGGILPNWIVRIFLTFNNLFGSFLSFSIPLIILGLISSSIADLGNSAKRLILLTVALAWISTLFSGFFTYFVSSGIFPSLVTYAPAFGELDPEAGLLTGYFALEMPPVFGVTTALILAFVLGIGLTVAGNGGTLHKMLIDFRRVVEKLIAYVIVPLLPFYIFGIFLNMRVSGAAFQVITVFGKIILVIFILHIVVLALLFIVGSLVSKKNPLRLIINMLPAYMTALGTASSAATIPVTLQCVKKNGVDEEVADFTVPLCATIHMPGSMLKIVATSIAICIMQGIPHDLGIYTQFILTLSIAMVAAPGVPGGAIMVAAGVLQAVLGFDNNAVGLMIALYIAIDSFGTAANVTGDGAIAAIVDTFEKRSKAQVLE